MAGAAEVAGLLLVFYDPDLARAADIEDFSVYFCALDVGGADRSVFSVVHQENFIKRYLIPLFVFPAYFLNRKDVPLRDLVLFPARLYNRKFHEIHIIGNFTKKQDLL